MNFGSIAKHAEKAVVDNSPAILTAIGVTGVLVTVALVGKASFRAADILRQEEIAIALNEEEPEHVLDTRTKINLTWKEYVPAAVVGTITVAAVIGANHIGTRRAAALASAFSIAQKASEEYKAKVLDKMGKNKERQVRDEVAQDRVDRIPPPRTDILLLKDDDHKCYDSWSNQEFTARIEDIRAAVNTINERVNNQQGASLADYYGLLGIQPTFESDSVGWNSDQLMRVDISAAIRQGGPVLVVDFLVEPIRKYWREYR